VLTGIAAVIGAGTAAFVAMRANSSAGLRPGIEQHASQPASPSAPKPESQAAPPATTTPLIGQKGFTGPMGPLEAGISYNQGDIYDNPAESAQDCAKMCADDNRCLAVTYIISQKRCWVKNKTLSIGASPDMVSSRKLIQ
jgi:hypothetical protein